MVIANVRISAIAAGGFWANLVRDAVFSSQAAAFVSKAL